MSTATYPAQSTLYWRVQANDEDGIALTSSSTGTFKQVLPIRTAALGLYLGDVIPTLRWASVNGAIGYDVHVVLPEAGVHQRLPRARAGDGAGRARRGGCLQLAGARRLQRRRRRPLLGKAVPFERDLNPVTQTSLARHRRAMTFSWKGRPGLERYILVVASRPDFSGGVETDVTDGTVVASLLTSGAYAKGGRFFWHVEAVDADGNSTGFSATKVFRLRRNSIRR